MNDNETDPYKLGWVGLETITRLILAYREEYITVRSGGEMSG